MPTTLHGTSRQEIEVYNFIKMQLPKCQVLKNNRSVINGRELDIYVPSKKVAVEFNGLFYHSDNTQSDPFYHLYKSVECEKRGIQLIHVMSDEWEQKKPLVQDLIKKALGIHETVNISICNLKEINEREGKAFMESHCIQSYDQDSILYYGIFFEGDKLAVASFKKADSNWVLTRYIDRKGYKVRDGLKAILESFLQTHPKPLTASLDRRLYSNAEYKSVGFKEVAPSNPNVTVTKDFKKRFPLNPKMTEKQLQEKGWHKVYDCGERRFILS